MNFVDALKLSSNSAEDCVRYLLVWLASIDGDIHDDERRWLEESLGQRKHAMALDRIVQCVRDHDATQDAFVLRWLGETLDDAGRQLLVELAIGVVRADGRVMHSEVHALRLIADAMRISPSAFARIYRVETNTDLPHLADLSDALYWKQAEQTKEKSDQTSASGSSGAQAGARDEDAKTREAWSVLGIEPGSGVDEIKSAYRRLAAVHHPDRFQALGGSAADVATKTFQRIKAAYDHLVARAGRP